MRSPELLERLEQLNAEIRAVGSSLIDKDNPSPTINRISADLQENPSNWILRLGDGCCLDLNLPLNELFYQVFSAVIARDLPHFQTIRVKMRSFDVLSSTLDLDRKRKLCLWLEEAICNVGKHAEGATQIKVTGQLSQGQYILTVQDNGCGLKTASVNPSTSQNHKLAKRLGGQFQRESLPKRDTLCTLSWPVSLPTPHQNSNPRRH